MATNRLFLYDPDVNEALMIGRGFPWCWSLTGPTSATGEWLETHAEYTGEITSTRFQLKTEQDLPEGCLVTFEKVVAPFATRT